MRTVTLILLTLTAALCMAVPARADDVVTTDPAWFTEDAGTVDVTSQPRTQTALAIASAQWGVDLTGLTVVVHAAPSDGGMWGATGIPRIVVNAASMPVYDANPLAFCIGIVHESGHELGHGHDSDPNSVMYGGDDHGTPLNAWAASPGCVSATGKWVDQGHRADYDTLDASTDRWPARLPASLHGDARTAHAAVLRGGRRAYRRHQRRHQHRAPHYE